MYNSFTSTIERFPGKGGWYFLRLPEKITPPSFIKKTRYGFIPIIARIGEMTWETSLLPGHGWYFIALKKDIRHRLKLEAGHTCTVQWDFNTVNF